MGGAVSIPTDSGLPINIQAIVTSTFNDKGEAEATTLYNRYLVSKSWFICLDSDGNGNIDQKEMKRALRGLPKPEGATDHQGMLIVDLMKALNNDEGDGITMENWLLAIDTNPLRMALEAAWDPVTKRLKGLMTLEENLSRVDEEIAALQEKLKMLQAKRSKMASKINATSPNSNNNENAATDDQSAEEIRAAEEFVKQSC